MKIAEVSEKNGLFVDTLAKMYMLVAGIKYSSTIQD